MRSSSVRPIPWRLGVAAVLMSCISSCGGKTTNRPAWPDAKEDDILDVKLVPGTIEAPKELSNTAQVQPDRLVFPRSAAADVIAAWPVGKPVVGAPSDARGKDNPFGFLRKVKAVDTDGPDIVVETEPASIQDVLTGTARVNVDLQNGQDIELDEETVARYFPEIGAGEGLPPPDVAKPVQKEWGKLKQALHGNVEVGQVFDQTVTLPVFSVNKDRTYGSGSRAVTVHIQGSGTLTSQFKFSPTLILAFETGITSGLDYFNVEAKGPMKIQSTLDVNVGVTAASGSEPTSLVDLATLLAEGPETGSLPPVVLARSAPRAGPVILGIPTTFRLSLLGDCNFGIQASSNARATVTLEATRAEAALTYTDDSGWYNSSDFKFDKKADASLTFGGGVAVECGITSRVEWLVGDAGGPYLGVRGAVKARSAYVDVCEPLAPENGKPDGHANAAIDAKVQLQVGGKVDAWKVVKFEKGPYNIYETTFPDLWKTEKVFPKGGLGYCFVDCGNKILSGNESDVDCGANCLKCTKGKHCKAPSDCLSNACGLDGLCVGSTCEDGVKGQDETDIDCGGPLCPRCNTGSGCRTYTDCTTGLCSRADRPPQLCTTNFCEDGVVSGGESDVDCGNVYGCASRCNVGQQCRTDADCTSDACNLNTNRCVESKCVDERRDGDEPTTDCGASCAKKCALGDRCSSSRGGTDCASGFCSTSGLCVASVHEDGFANGGETGPDCGGNAPNRCGRGNHCNDSSDCQSGDVCNGRTLLCAEPGCNDAVKNGAETSVDCGGGTCAKCGVAKACLVDTDCATNVCGGGKCVTDTCADGVKQATESDVDCGAVCGAKKCATGKACTTAVDCASNICSKNVCISDACKDRVRNGSETDTDCGGTTCALRCATGQTCNAGTDCASGLCNASTHQCVGGPCEDGAKNGTESDVDCGGTCSTKCAINKGCSANADCGSGTCSVITHRCVPGPCFDGVKNGDETDVDCGGACPGKCAFDKGCGMATDCQSGACMAPSLTCAADQCSDGRLNGDETGLDCGGSCATDCGVGLGCLSGGDCTNPDGLVGVPGYCNVATHLCSATSCGDGLKDGDETGLDCGGSCATKCENDSGCNTPNDCASTWCNVNTHKCVSSQCGDGIKQANERDIDCGYICGVGTCRENQACVDGSIDCQSGFCSSAGLCLPSVPATCWEVWNRNGPGDRSNGVKVIDPDGPRRPHNGPGTGADAPIATYCDMANGGWTPAMYLNSYDLGHIDMADFRSGQERYTWDMDRSTWERQNRYSCTVDADCYARSGQGSPSVPAGSVCHQNKCVGTATYNGLPSAPGPYSIPSATVVPPQSYMMNMQNRATLMRLDVYRNNVLLWSTPEINLTSRRLSGGQNGYYFTPDAGVGDLLWLRCAYEYLWNTGTSEDNPIGPWSEMSPPNSTDLNYRCHGWSTNTGIVNYNPSSSLGGYASVLNFFQESADVRRGYVKPFTGAMAGRDGKYMWGAWVNFGFPKDVANGGAFRMGTCNTIGACYAPQLRDWYYYTDQTYRKDYGARVPTPPIGGEVGNFNYMDEINNPRSGTELQSGTTGLVFVWWVK